MSEIGIGRYKHTLIVGITGRRKHLIDTLVIDHRCYIPVTGIECVGQRYIVHVLRAEVWITYCFDGLIC